MMQKTMVAKSVMPPRLAKMMSQANQVWNEACALGMQTLPMR